MIHDVAMGRRRKIGVCVGILTLRVLFASLIALNAPFVVHARSDERTEEMAEDGEEIIGAGANNKPGGGRSVFMRGIVPPDSLTTSD